MMRSTRSISDSPRSSDNELLTVARREERVIITADLDYPRLIALQQADRPGVILFRGGAYSDRERLALLARVLARTPPRDLEHSIVVVDPRRVRRRAVPMLKYPQQPAAGAPAGRAPPGGGRIGAVRWPERSDHPS